MGMGMSDREKGKGRGKVNYDERASGATYESLGDREHSCVPHFPYPILSYPVLSCPILSYQYQPLYHTIPYYSITTNKPSPDHLKS